MLQYKTTPIQEIYENVLRKAGIRLLIKREDLNHRYVSGNKWWKLKYNIAEAIAKKHQTLLTFGGAYSNHIFATAAAAAELKLKSVGIIRGEKTLPLNPTLAFAQERGMDLHYISRAAYRQKSHAEFDVEKFENPFVIPEGGTNALAVKGVREFARSIDVHYHYLCCPVGTAGTITGFIEALPTKKIVGFPVLKQGEFLVDEIKKLSERSARSDNWQLVQDYHFGGYAKTTPELRQFVERFKDVHGIPLDTVYTGKMMAGIFDLIQKNFFKSGSVILAVHTGGLQLGAANRSEDNFRYKPSPLL